MLSFSVLEQLKFCRITWKFLLTISTHTNPTHRGRNVNSCNVESNICTLYHPKHFAMCSRNFIILCTRLEMVVQYTENETKRFVSIFLRCVQTTYKNSQTVLSRSNDDHSQSTPINGEKLKITRIGCCWPAERERAGGERESSPKRHPNQFSLCFAKVFGEFIDAHPMLGDDTLPKCCRLIYQAAHRQKQVKNIGDESV